MSATHALRAIDLHTFPGDRAHVIMAQGARAGAINAHDQAAGGIGADGAAVGFHPIGRMIVPLLGRQQGNHRLQRIETKIGIGGQGNFATAQLKAVADAHGTGAVALDFLDDNGEIVKLKLIGTHAIVHATLPFCTSDRGDMIDGFANN